MSPFVSVLLLGEIYLTQTISRTTAHFSVARHTHSP